MEKHVRNGTEKMNRWWDEWSRLFGIICPKYRYIQIYICMYNPNAIVRMPLLRLYKHIANTVVGAGAPVEKNKKYNEKWYKYARTVCEPS